MQLTVYVQIIFANDWIWITDLWNPKWPIYQLSRNHLLWGQDDDAENVSKKSKSADDAEEDALAPELELGPNVELVITQAAAVGDVEAGVGHVRLGHVDERIILYLETCSR